LIKEGNLFKIPSFDFMKNKINDYRKQVEKKKEFIKIKSEEIKKKIFIKNSNDVKVNDSEFKLKSDFNNNNNNNNEQLKLEIEKIKNEEFDNIDIDKNTISQIEILDQIIEDYDEEKLIEISNIEVIKNIYPYNIDFFNNFCKIDFDENILIEFLSILYSYYSFPREKIQEINEKIEQEVIFQSLYCIYFRSIFESKFKVSLLCSIIIKNLETKI
jgi:hypothetical protein